MVEVEGIHVSQSSTPSQCAALKSLSAFQGDKIPSQSWAHGTKASCQFVGQQPGPVCKAQDSPPPLSCALHRLPSEISLGRAWNQSASVRMVRSPSQRVMPPSTQTLKPELQALPLTPLSPYALIYHHTLSPGLLRIFLNLSASEDPQGSCPNTGPDQPEMPLSNLDLIDLLSP